jgi:hypothetical protein
MLGDEIRVLAREMGVMLSSIAGDLDVNPKNIVRYLREMAEQIEQMETVAIARRKKPKG